MDGDQAVRTFVNSFLIPIVEDGRLDAVEETPLMVAYEVLVLTPYGIEEDVIAYLKRRIQRASEDVTVKVTVEVQQKALAILLRDPARLSISDADMVVKWMQSGWQVFPEGKEEVTLVEMAGTANWGGQKEAIVSAVLAILGKRSEGLMDGPFAGATVSLDAARGFPDLVRKLLLECEPALSPSPAATAPGAAAKPQEQQTVDVGVGPSPPPQTSRCVEYACTADDLAPCADPSAVTRHIRARAEELADWLDARVGGKAPWWFALDAKCERPEVLIVRKADDVPRNLWFVGDLHGDILALEAVLGYVDQVTMREKLPFPCVVFLGDLFDRMQYGYEVALRVLALVKDRPGQILWLAGNHDEALKLSETSGSFVSLVSPAEFADWLNGEATKNPIAGRIGKGLARLGAALPRAVFLPDGLIAAHGGVPHTDLLARIETVGSLNAKECLQDFVWTRLHPRARQRVPNRNSKTCDLGILDFEAFCARAASVIGQPVARMVRGHDHVERRFDYYANYKANPVLTMNTLCCRQDGEWGEQYARTPCVARHRPGNLPEVHRLTIPVDLVKAYYPC
jgi:hypothetical protein